MLMPREPLRDRLSRRMTERKAATPLHACGICGGSVSVANRAGPAKPDAPLTTAFGPLFF